MNDFENEENDGPVIPTLQESEQNEDCLAFKYAPGQNKSFHFRKSREEKTKQLSQKSCISIILSELKRYDRRVAKQIVNDQIA